MPYYMQDLYPDCSAAIGLIKHLNKDELNQLLNDDDKLENLVKDLPQVKNAEAEREMLFASNRSIAEFNLSQEPRLQQSRHQLQELHQQALDLKQQIEEKKKQLDEKSRQTSLDTVLALLQTAAAQSEEETENIAQSFLDGNTTIESFREEFLEKRKQMHLRRIKTEKMTELLTRSQQQPQHSVGFMGNHPARPAPPPPTFSMPVNRQPFDFPLAGPQHFAQPGGYPALPYSMSPYRQP